MIVIRRTGIQIYTLKCTVIYYKAAWRSNYKSNRAAISQYRLYLTRVYKLFNAQIKAFKASMIDIHVCLVKLAFACRIDSVTTYECDHIHVRAFIWYHRGATPTGIVGCEQNMWITRSRHIRYTDWLFVHSFKVSLHCLLFSPCEVLTDKRGVISARDLTYVSVFPPTLSLHYLSLSVFSSIYVSLSITSLCWQCYSCALKESNATRVDIFGLDSIGRLIYTFNKEM